MPIPHDLENRWWVDSTVSNPSYVDELRPAMLAFIAFGPDREISIEGSGFIIAGSQDFAAVFTAKHVLLEGAFRTQRPHQRHAPSALFIPKSHTKPSIEAKSLKVLWMGLQNASMMDVNHLIYNDSTDVAGCIIIPELDSGPFQPVSIPIDTDVPSVGEVIHMVSLDNLSVSTDTVEIGEFFSLSRRISVRVGVVTGVYPKGYRQYKWPCFTTSIPAMPGMSGGFVTLPKKDKTVAACGIVCADNSPDEARNNQSICGDSVVASTWTSLGLRLPESLPAAKSEKQTSIYEFMRSGKMPMAVGGIDHIDIRERDNGDYSIRRRGGP